jgi:hypothetical protein
MRPAYARMIASTTKLFEEAHANFAAPTAIQSCDVVFHIHANVTTHLFTSREAAT